MCKREENGENEQSFFLYLTDVSLGCLENT